MFSHEAGMQNDSRSSIDSMTRENSMISRHSFSLHYDRRTIVALHVAKITAFQPSLFIIPKIENFQHESTPALRDLLSCHQYVAQEMLGTAKLTVVVRSTVTETVAAVGQWRDVDTAMIVEKRHNSEAGRYDHISEARLRNTVICFVVIEIVFRLTVANRCWLSRDWPDGSHVLPRIAPRQKDGVSSDGGWRKKMLAWRILESMYYSSKW